MKPITNLTINDQLPRHDLEGQTMPHFPATDYFFQEEAVSSHSRIHHQTADPAACRSFCRMVTETVAAQSQRDPLEMLVLAVLSALLAWPLVDLLIVLAQTANG
jgi:hypothetical protein